MQNAKDGQGKSKGKWTIKETKLINVSYMCNTCVIYM